MKKIALLYEDEFCLVFNKPAGLPVQGGEKVGASLDSILSQERKVRPLLVHRLDKETSGCILLAKNQESARWLSQLFAGKVGTEKRYLGVCQGALDSQRGIIATPLAIRGKVLPATTAYRVLAEITLEEGDFSLVQLELASGRMHQIRRHLAQLGHPLLGDDKYGNFALNSSLRKSRGLKNLLLHASRLILRDEQRSYALDVTAPLPEYFAPFANPE